jgi:hypothetical protein
MVHFNYPPHCPKTRAISSTGGSRSAPILLAKRVSSRATIAGEAPFVPGPWQRTSWSPAQQPALAKRPNLSVFRAPVAVASWWRNLPPYPVTSMGHPAQNLFVAGVTWRGTSPVNSAREASQNRKAEPGFLHDCQPAVVSSLMDPFLALIKAWSRQGKPETLEWRGNLMKLVVVTQWVSTVCKSHLTTGAVVADQSPKAGREVRPKRPTGGKEQRSRALHGQAPGETPPPIPASLWTAEHGWSWRGQQRLCLTNRMHAWRTSGSVGGRVGSVARAPSWTAFPHLTKA